MKQRIAIVVLTIATGLALATTAGAQTERPDNWSQIKCERYGAAWAEALRRKGSSGLGRDFIERHEAFLASGCTRAADVCPRSAAELEMANIMVIMAMNAGTASTFPPFSCKEQGRGC